MSHNANTFDSDSEASQVGFVGIFDCNLTLEAHCFSSLQESCPTSITSQEQASVLLQRALEVREAFHTLKQDALARLQDALTDAKIADKRLFDIELQVGKLYHLIATSGFSIPLPVVQRQTFPVTTEGGMLIPFHSLIVADYHVTSHALGQCWWNR